MVTSLRSQRNGNPNFNRFYTVSKHIHIAVHIFCQITISFDGDPPEKDFMMFAYGESRRTISTKEDNMVSVEDFEN